ncbi:MAG: hypothetical protein GC156_01355 [Actinomycetales bacterium]|nr:hypothetical protein [Actinomycetales bacterium]
MNHRYRSEPYPTEPIEVAMGTDGAPVRFRWRGRRYVVRAVMTTWVESVPWWPQSRGQEGARWPQSRGQEGARWPQSRGQEGARWPQSRGQQASGQRIAWRVEAAAATGAVGVYELCRIRCGPGDGVGEEPDEVDLWGLLRVID